MKAGQFNQFIAEALSVPQKTVTVFTRALKEAGQLTSGRGGRAAPEMKPLDTSRTMIALLSTASPAEAAARVHHFGPLEFSPDLMTARPGCRSMSKAEFETIFTCSTLEDVLTEIVEKPSRIGVSEALAWFEANPFFLRITETDVLAELVRWDRDGDQIIGETVVPFKGESWDFSEGVPIRGGIRTERAIAPIQLTSLAVGMATDGTADG